MLLTPDQPRGHMRPDPCRAARHRPQDERRLECLRAASQRRLGCLPLASKGHQRGWESHHPPPGTLDVPPRSLLLRLGCLHASRLRRRVPRLPPGTSVTSPRHPTLRLECLSQNSGDGSPRRLGERGRRPAEKKGQYPDLPELSREGAPPATEFVHMVAQGRSRAVPLQRIRRDLEDLGVAAHVHRGELQGKEVALISLQGARPQPSKVAASINCVRSLGWYVRETEAGSTTQNFRLAKGGRASRPAGPPHVPAATATKQATCETPPQDAGPTLTNSGAPPQDAPPASTAGSTPPPETPRSAPAGSSDQQDVPPTANAGPLPDCLGVTMTQIGGDLIQLDLVGRMTVKAEAARKAIEQCGGDVRRAARLLAQPSSVEVEDLMEQEWP